MKYTIYDKTGRTAKCAVDKIEYNGEFMGACNVICSVKSPTPVDFVIGDYLDYRGERFYINYDPSVIKKSSKLSVGDAFVYDNIVLNSAIDELSRCDFLDYVLSDNLVHFSSLPDFSFFAPSVKDLADRIQANLDRIYKGEQKWTVTIHPDCVGEKNQNISANRIKVWDALALANSIFKLNFIIRGRHIIIGTAGIAANKVFKYGQGNGLKEIERSSDDSQAVITRLRVYGSQKNLPHRYYNKIGAKYFVKDIVYRHADTSAEPYYILDAKLGKAFSEDMFNDLHEHITQPTESFTYRCVVTVNGITLPCGIECSPKSDSVGVMFTQSFCSDKALRTKAVQSMLQTTPTEVLFESGVNIDNVPAGNVRNPNYMANNMAVNFLMLPGFPDKTLDPYIDSKNIDSLGVREGSVFFDGSNGNEEIYPSIEGMTVSQLESAGIYVDVDAGDNGNLDEVFAAEQATDDGFWDKVPEGKNIPNFTITLKDLGFNLNEYVSTETMKICMKDGMCGGREFEVLGGKDKPVKKGNKWIVTCSRVNDDSLNLYFPYKDYNIKAGDKFVLTGLEMPDVYIKAASQRLLDAGKKFLAKNDYSRNVYSHKVDDKELAEEHRRAHANNEKSIYDTIKEGDLMLFEDADININGSIIIDHLSITEEYGNIPHYEITLREEKSVGTLDKIQQQIDSIFSGNGIGGGLNTEQVKSLVRLVGGLNFLSKKKPDETNHLLKLLGGVVTDNITSQGFVNGGLGAGFTLHQNPNTGRSYMEVDELYVRMKALFESLVIKELQSVGGQVLLTIANMECNKVEVIENGAAYRCYFAADDGEKAIANQFVIGDQAQCRQMDLKPGVYGQAGNRFYWRYVVGVGDNYIDLSASDCTANSDIPQAGDKIIQLGHRTDFTRQNAILLSAYGNTAPNVQMLQGINSFSLDGKAVKDEGFDSLTQQFFSNLYGRSYIGARDKSNYIKYTPGEGVEVKGTIKLQTPDGKVWQVTSEDGINRVGDLNGSRVEINPNTCDLKVLNGNNNPSTIIEGKNYSYIEQVYPTEAPVITPLTRNELAKYDCVIDHTINITTSYSKKEVFNPIKEKKFEIKGECTLFYLPIIWTKVSIANSRGYVSYMLRAFRYNDAGDVVETIQILSRKFDRHTPNGSTTSFPEPMPCKLKTPGVYSLQVDVEAFMLSSAETVEIKFSSIQLSLVRSGFATRIFSNGIVVGDKETNMFSLFNKEDGYGFSTLYATIENEGAGIKVDSDRLLGKSAKVHGSINAKYGLIPLLMAYGEISGSETSVYVSSKSVDNSTMTGQRMRIGKYKISIPASWGLSANDYYVMLTAIGYNFDTNQYTLKATLIEQQSTYFIVELSDDLTPNDGKCYFEIKLK